MIDADQSLMVALVKTVWASIMMGLQVPLSRDVWRRRCPFLVSAFFLVRLTKLHPSDACSASLGPSSPQDWLGEDPWLKSGVANCRTRATSCRKGGE